MDRDRIVVFVSPNCGPCQDVQELIQEGRVIGAPEVEIVDIETDEGFDRFVEQVLSKGEGAAPMAFRGEELCEILYDDENDTLQFRCPTTHVLVEPSDPPPAAP